jgi:heme/copper-type cytochrome/quinol oxidase subunit 2
MNKTLDCLVLSAFVIAFASLSGIVGMVIVTALYLLCGERARQTTKSNHPHPWKCAGTLCYVFGPVALLVVLCLTALYELLVSAGANET